MIGLLSIVVGLLVFAAVYVNFEPLYLNVSQKFIVVHEETVQLYKDLFSKKEAKQVLIEQSVVSSIFAILALFLFWPGILGLVFAVLAFFYAWRFPLLYLKKIYQPKRVAEFSNQMVDALTLMSNALRSGLNIPQALQAVVSEMKGPVQQEFGLVLSENQLGLTLEDALENLNQRMGSEDVQMFVTSVNILRETGGNIAETFDTITTTIRERLKLKSKIDAMTAQGKMSSYIVGSLPWVLGGVLYTLDPANMQKLFVTVPGWVILAGVLTLEIVGFVVITKIVDIKV